MAKSVCCFCNESVEIKNTWQVSLKNCETGELSNLGNWFCHEKCFEKAMHAESKKIYDYIKKHEN